MKCAIGSLPFCCTYKAGPVPSLVTLKEEVVVVTVLKITSSPNTDKF